MIAIGAQKIGVPIVVDDAGNLVGKITLNATSGTDELGRTVRGTITLEFGPQ
jgi:hypothetical protein